MSVATGLFVITWAAMIALYLCMVWLQRELIATKARLTRIERRDSVEALMSEIRLPAQGIAIWVNASCSSCHATMKALLAAKVSEPLWLVATEDEAPEWRDEAGAAVTVLTDASLWEAVTAWTPPILARVSPGGTVEDVVLPVTPEHVNIALQRWGLLGRERTDVVS